MTYHLYLKEHNITGLRYLGFTRSKDPYGYRGSGIKWKRHIDKYGYNVTTKIIISTDNKKELKWWGLYFSELFDIVKSEKWANLEEEYCGHNNYIGRKSYVMQNETKEKIRQSKLGKDRPDMMGDNNPSKRKESREKISRSKLGMKYSEQARKNMSLAHKGKSYEEIYGVEKATELKKMRSIKMKNNKHAKKKE